MFIMKFSKRNKSAEGGRIKVLMLGPFQIEKNGVKIYYFAKRRPKIISSLVRDLPVLRKKIKDLNPDIVHSSSEGAYASLKAGYPTIMTIHGIVWRDARFYRGFKGIGRRIIYPGLTRYVLKRLKHLILISPYVDEEVRFCFVKFGRRESNCNV